MSLEEAECSAAAVSGEQAFFGQYIQVFDERWCILIIKYIPRTFIHTFSYCLPIPRVVGLWDSVNLSSHWVKQPHRNTHIHICVEYSFQRNRFKWVGLLEERKEKKRKMNKYRY